VLVVVLLLLALNETADFWRAVGRALEAGEQGWDSMQKSAEWPAALTRARGMRGSIRKSNSGVVPTP
jgi:hypothetical protein